ncbi:hypothetical protein, partial [Streptomyces alboverticillatus]
PQAVREDLAQLAAAVVAQYAPVAGATRPGRAGEGGRPATGPAPSS